MRKRVGFLTVLAVAGGAGLRADFSYEQTSKITGGMMAGMMKVAGVFSKQAREPIKSTVMVKGDRMAHLMGGRSAQIIDLSKETITEVNFEKKTYSVMTFAEFSEALKQMDARMKGQKKDGENQAEMSYKASVKETGQKKMVAGYNTSEYVLTLEMEGTDKKTGNKIVAMGMNSDMWLTPDIAGYDEVQRFYQRMATKINWSPNMGMMQAAGTSEGMGQLTKEMSKMKGVPVFQVIKMGGPAGQGAEGQQAGGAQPQQQQRQTQAEKPSVGSALGGALGGKLGGLGGFGRKKKQDQDQQQEQPAQTQSSQTATGEGQPAPGSLLEMESELSGFSTSPVDPSKFDVPSGFKQVESPMLKMAK